MDANYEKCKRYLKHKNSFRLLLVQTPNYDYVEYTKLKNEYNKNMYNFHKYNIKLITYKNKNYDFKIGLVGYDGELKKVYKKFNKLKIIEDIKKMPIGEKESKINKKALSLYEDYNPKTTMKGLGFKNKETALLTIEKIKTRPLKYQKSVINTMLYRSTYHPSQTKEMRDAMKIFKKWKKDN